MSSIALVRRSAAASLCFILALCTFTFSQTLTVLHTFHVSDGEHPDSGLIRGSDGNLYGTTVVGGSAGCGTVFKITQSGKFASIYSFLGGNDGCNPEASVIRDAAGNLYGTTVSRWSLQRWNRIQDRQFWPRIGCVYLHRKSRWRKPQ